LLVFCLFHSSFLKMEATYYSKCRFSFLGLSGYITQKMELFENVKSYQTYRTSHSRHLHSHRETVRNRLLSILVFSWSISAFIIVCSF
jgi:hypothetical protein